MLKVITSFCLVILVLLQIQVNAEATCKFDLGVALINIDILESGKTIDTLHMRGIKGDAVIRVWKGVFVKPSFIIAGHQGKLESFSLGIGHFLPVNKKFLLLPSVGVTFSYLRTTIDFEALGLFDLTEKFRSSSPYVALEFTYSVTPRWTIMGMVQYAWSRTHTIIKPIVSDKSHSEGPNYALGFDYSLNSKWSITGGAGYNITLSREKHGLRGKGIKLGIAYYY